MIVHKDGNFRIVKDGSTYYRVFEGRKRIGSFLFKTEAIDYVEMRKILLLKN